LESTRQIHPGSAPAAPTRKARCRRGELCRWQP
jgi:hypothetical protein